MEQVPSLPALEMLPMYLFVGGVGSDGWDIYCIPE